jgi:hypothetical protein
MNDTPHEVNRFIHQRMMALAPERRFLMGFSMLATARQLAMNSIPPHLPHSEKMRSFYERMYGEACPVPGVECS